MGHARALLSIDAIEQQVSLAGLIVTKTLSVRETEQLVKRSHGVPFGSAAKRSTVSNNPESANILAAETKLSKRLGAPVKIKMVRNGGIIEIKFSSSDDLSRLFDSLVRAHAGNPRGD